MSKSLIFSLFCNWVLSKSTSEFWKIQTNCLGIQVCIWRTIEVSKVASKERHFIGVCWQKRNQLYPSFLLNEGCTIWKQEKLKIHPSHGTVSQSGKFLIFLSLRFYVKSNLWILICQFWLFWNYSLGEGWNLPNLQISDPELPKIAVLELLHSPKVDFT